MAASAASLDARVMFPKLFTSCFQKRNGHTQNKSPSSAIITHGHGVGASETESGDSCSESRDQVRDKPPPVHQTRHRPEREGHQAAQEQQQKHQSVAISSTNTTTTTITTTPSPDPDMGKLHTPKSIIKSIISHKSKPKPKYFNGNGSDDVATESSTVKLNDMFDALLSEQDIENDSSRKTMSAESIEAYAKLMNVDHLSYELFVVLDIVQAISFSEMTRGGYVDGWKQVSVDSRVPADTAAHRKYVRACIDKLPRDPAYFKRVYQRAFQVGKEPAQKALDKEIAIVFWDMLFGEKVRPWQTRNVNWLDVWKRYLEEKWTRSVNKDMWSQTLHFAEKTMEDETLGFWSEDQAWPGVIDDFVVWCREKGVVKAKADVVEVMEVDD